VLRALGISDVHGRVKPSRQAKYRQVEEFLRLLDASLSEAIAQGRVRTPTPEDPLRIVDLGCGNAYLTFAAHAFLSQRLPVRMTGIDVKEQSAEHNSAVAARLGIDADFVVGTIGGARLGQAPDVVLALHACDTATDDALARALEWKASLVLAAPCCHHDIAAQLRTTQAPEPYAMLTRHGILRERFADTLTDALRATLLRREGYRVDVVEFVESAHTPRNTLLRAVRTEGGSDAAAREYDDLVATWRVRPRLGELLGRP
jgi:SAM-dependent methyltransferase